MKFLKSLPMCLFAICLILGSVTKGQTKAPFSIKSANASEFLTGERSALKNQIHAKAIRHFHKKYENDMQESWRQVSDGYLAQFSNRGIKNRVFYTMKGNYLCTILDYNEDQIPEDIIISVNGYISGYRVSHVTSIEFLNSKASMIHIKNGVQYKILRMADGGIEVIGEYLDIKK